MTIPPEVEILLGNQYAHRQTLRNAFHSLCEALGKSDHPIYGHLKKTERYVGLYNFDDVPFAYVDFQRTQIKFGLFEEDFGRIGNHSLPIVPFPEWSNRRNARLVGTILSSDDSAPVNNLATVLIECYKYTPDGE